MKTLRVDAAIVLLAFALMFLFSRTAPGSAPPEIRAQATVDRVEEDWLVLDLPPHPSLPIPHEMAAWARESDAVEIRVSRARRSRTYEDPPRSPWIAQVIQVSPLRLRSGEDATIEFGWPAALAPPVRVGDRLDFLIEPAPATIGGA